MVFAKTGFTNTIMSCTMLCMPFFSVVVRMGTVGSLSNDFNNGIENG